MPSFTVKDSVALVTGVDNANGVGHAIVEALLRAGAAKVYATARKTSHLDDFVTALSSSSKSPRHSGRVVAVELDIANLGTLEGLSQSYPDVTIVVNSAGYAGYTNSVQDIEKPLVEMLVNYMAPLTIGKSFAPVFAKLNGNSSNLKDCKVVTKPSALININCISSFVNFPDFATYSASKAACHSLTQAQRRDMKNTLVIGVYPGPVINSNTGISHEGDNEKVTPSAIAFAIVDALHRGTEDVFPGIMAKALHSEWKLDAKRLERNMAIQ